MKKTGSEQHSPAEAPERVRLQAEVARQRVRLAKDELKRARKRLKEAKREAKRARKLASAARKAWKRARRAQKKSASGKTPAAVPGGAQAARRPARTVRVRPAKPGRKAQRRRHVTLAQGVGRRRLQRSAAKRVRRAVLARRMHRRRVRRVRTGMLPKTSTARIAAPAQRMPRRRSAPRASGRTAPAADVPVAAHTPGPAPESPPSGLESATVTATLPDQSP